jgi:hypothetical protein
VGHVATVIVRMALYVRKTGPGNGTWKQMEMKEKQDVDELLPFAVELTG